MVTPPRKWLITGGCGFIGSSLIRTLKKEQLADAIRVVDNLSTGSVAALGNASKFETIDPSSPGIIREKSHAELLVANICDMETAIKACQGAEIIVHLAANTGVQPSIENPLQDMETNIRGTVNYLEACRANQVKAFIFASSGAPIGPNQPPIHEDMPCHPVSPYGASKLAGEAYCSAYHGSFGINTVALRFSNVYGPFSRHKNSVVARFIKRALNNKPLIIYGDGMQTRDFIYIDDLVNAIISAGCSGMGGEVFQIGTGEETSIKALAQMLSDVLKQKSGTRPQTEYRPPLPGEVSRNFADISKARHALDWTPCISLTQGLKQTVNWFLDNNDEQEKWDVPV